MKEKWASGSFLAGIPHTAMVTIAVKFLLVLFASSNFIFNVVASSTPTMDENPLPNNQLELANAVNANASSEIVVRSEKFFKSDGNLFLQVSTFYSV